MTETPDRAFVVESDELEVGDRVVVEVAGMEIAVVRTESGLYAVGNYCPHMGGPCGQGMISGMYDRDVGEEMQYQHHDEVVSCPWHGWEFSLETGEHLAKSGSRLPTYEVTETDGEIYVLLD
ncbi:(2Fe-2S)-binding protein [Halobacteriales archaeon QS_1_68_20]|nr:MAG: (2Fe-2S)-binding protein [Halobacteriales archaeon QS_1_68_20]